MTWNKLHQCISVYFCRLSMTKAKLFCDILFICPWDYNVKLILQGFFLLFLFRIHNMLPMILIRHCSKTKKSIRSSHWSGYTSKKKLPKNFFIFLLESGPKPNKISWCLFHFLKLNLALFLWMPFYFIVKSVKPLPRYFSFLFFLSFWNLIKYKKK